MITDAVLKFFADAAVWVVGLLPTGPGFGGGSWNFDWNNWTDMITGTNFQKWFSIANYFLPLREVLQFLGVFVAAYGFVVLYRFLLRIKPW